MHRVNDLPHYCCQALQEVGGRGGEAVLQSGIYAINVLATKLPTVIVLLLWNVAGINLQVLSMGADWLLSLAGFANACTFFWQSRYSRETIHNIAWRENDVDSFNVAFKL